MIENDAKCFCFMFISVFLIVSCAGTRTELTQTQAGDAYTGLPLSNFLVIAVTGNEHDRRAYENKFVARLQSAGVKAVASEEAMPMPPDLKLQKGTILDAVSQYGNDAVIITQLVGQEKREIRTRDQYSIGPFFYYSSYPGYSNESKKLRLETNLYDAKTGELIWSGQSDTLSQESTDQIMNDVIKAVINSWQKDNIIAQ